MHQRWHHGIRIQLQIPGREQLISRDNVLFCLQSLGNELDANLLRTYRIDAVIELKNCNISQLIK